MEAAVGLATFLIIEFVEKDIFDKIMSDSENDEKENL